MRAVLRCWAWLGVCVAVSLQAQAQPMGDAAWWSYRDAYRALVRFEKLGQPKHLIQQRVQVQARSAGLSSQGLRLRLQGPRTAVELPLDGALHAQVPLLKAAFDDNAALVLNRSAAAFAFRVRVSIAPRADGQYTLNELRAACAQVHDVLQQTDPDRYRGKRCVGVTLAFAPESRPGVSLHQAEVSNALISTPGPLYPGEADREYTVVQWRWERMADASQLQLQLRAAQLPLVIAALIE